MAAPSIKRLRLKEKLAGRGRVFLGDKLLGYVRYNLMILQQEHIVGSGDGQQVVEESATTEGHLYEADQEINFSTLIGEPTITLELEERAPLDLRSSR
jgi:hypothetical protein